MELGLREKDVVVSFSPTASVYGESPSKTTRNRTVILPPEQYGILREHDVNTDKTYYHLLVSGKVHLQLQEIQNQLLEEHDFERTARKMEVRDNSTVYGQADWKIYPYVKIEPLYALKNSETHYLRFRVIYWENRSTGILKKGVSIYNVRSLLDPEGKSTTQPFHQRKLELI